MPLTRRQVLFRRRVTVFGGVALVIALGIYLPLTLLAPLGLAAESPKLPSFGAAKAATPAWPQFGGSAFGAVGDAALLQTGGSQEPLPIASISKIVTALVVLQAKPLPLGEDGPDITFSQADHDLYGKYVAQQGTVETMPVGATMTEHQVLQVALIASANNYAETLADWAFGNEDAFVAAAKTWLTAHSLTHTTLVEPTGIDPANTSTPTDLVALGRLALANPVLAPIVDTPTISLPVVGDIKDTNRLLGQQGVIGIKTGTLTTISNLLFASRFRVGGTTITVIGAVLGAPTRDDLYPAVTALLASIKAGFHAVTIATKGQALAGYSTAWGETANAVATKTVTTAVWSDRTLTGVVVPASLRTAKKGAGAGTASFSDGSRTVKVSLVLDHSLTEPGPWFRLTHPFSAFSLG